MRMAGGALTSAPRFQRFHDSTVGNGLHENAFRAFRGNRWERGNRAFVAIVGIVATVGIVGMRGTVISLESWRRGSGRLR